MPLFPFLSQHQEQSARLLKQRSSLLKRHVVESTTLRSIEQRVLTHWYAMVSAHNMGESISDDEWLALITPLFDAKLNSAAGIDWLQTVFNSTDKNAVDIDKVATVVQLIPEAFQSDSYEKLMGSVEHNRGLLFRWASLLGCSLSQECINRSIHSDDPIERASALRYAVYQSSVPVSFFTDKTNHQLSRNRPDELADWFHGALLRNAPAAVEQVLQTVSEIPTNAGQYELIRLLALSSDEKCLPVLREYCETDPDKGPWLLALHGLPTAIELLIDLLNQPTVAHSAVQAWRWLTAQPLPFADIQEQIKSVKQTNIQLPHEANQQAAKKWWYAQKANWSNNMAMWQGKPRTAELLKLEYSNYRGRITQDLWDMRLLTSRIVSHEPAKLRISYFEQCQSAVTSSFIGETA